MRHWSGQQVFFIPTLNVWLFVFVLFAHRWCPCSLWVCIPMCVITWGRGRCSPWRISQHWFTNRQLTAPIETVTSNHPSLCLAKRYVISHYFVWFKRIWLTKGMPSLSIFSVIFFGSKFIVYGKRNNVNNMLCVVNHFVGGLCLIFDKNCYYLKNPRTPPTKVVLALILSLKVSL